jgi:hypothetical protein
MSAFWGFQVAGVIPPFRFKRFVGAQIFRKINDSGPGGLFIAVISGIRRERFGDIDRIVGLGRPTKAITGI